MKRPQAVAPDTERAPISRALAGSARRGDIAPSRFRFLVTLALLAVGCGRAVQEEPTRRAPTPNVLLVTLDTVRADHLSAYGYPVATTPRLAALAREATLYERALSSAPWTIPAHASLFTGKHPFEHGAHDFEVKDPEASNVHPLDARHLTLAEALKAAGYSTQAFVANAGYLAPRWQLDQGFDSYRVGRAPASELSRRALKWLGGAGEQPFFLFVNYMDAHRPYNAVPRPGLLPRPVAPDRGRALQDLYQRVMAPRGPVPRELVQRVTDQYDTAIANLDEGLGLLLDGLRRLGLYERTLIVITSDHGEYLGEHQLVEHSKDLYQPVLWVPLVVKEPGVTKGRVERTPISSVDVPRLILSKLPHERVGSVLPSFPYEPGNHPLLAECYYTRAKDLVGKPWSSRFQRVRTALFDWPFKYIASSDGRHELFQLEADPAESSDLLARERGEAERLARSLQAFTAAHPRWQARDTPAPADADEREELRALGYVDGGP